MNYLDKVVTSSYYLRMMATGVKNLKTRLSEYLRYVRAGETVLVLDRDEVIAEIRPANRPDLAVLGVEETLDALAASGELSLPTSTEPFSKALGGGLKRFSVSKLGVSSKQLIDEQRTDRDIR